MIRRPPRSTLDRSSAASDVYKRQIYNGSNDASRVPPEWHGWLHRTFDELPTDMLPAPRAWEQAPTANLTGSTGAYRPAGALERGGQRAAATGDYEAWRPGE